MMISLRFPNVYVMVLLTDIRGQVILSFVHIMVFRKRWVRGVLSAGLEEGGISLHPSHIKSLLTFCFFFHADDAVDCVHADVKATASHVVGNESKNENLNVMACHLISIRNRTCYVKPEEVDEYTKGNAPPL